MRACINARARIRARAVRCEAALADLREGHISLQVRTSKTDTDTRVKNDTERDPESRLESANREEDSERRRGKMTRKVEPEGRIERMTRNEGPAESSFQK